MATANVVTTKTGTGWTIDVTACNLSSDLTVKDFVVIVAGSVASNTLFAKTTSNVLTYSGPALGASTSVQVRRKTPNNPIQTVEFAQRISSTDYNLELDRISRRAEEYELNGIGPGSVLSSAVPRVDAFGVAWNGDTLNPPSADAVYDYVSLLAPINSPTFTGVPTVPTASLATNTTQVASTAFVHSMVASYAPLASPTFTGTPSAPTAAERTNTTQVANTAYVMLSNRPAWDARRSAAVQALTNLAFTALIFDVEDQDTNNGYNNTTGEFTVPAGAAGKYSISAGCGLSGGVQRAAMSVFVNGVERRRMLDQVGPGNVLDNVMGSTTLSLVAGEVVSIRIYYDHSTAAARNMVNTSFLSFFSGYRVNT